MPMATKKTKANRIEIESLPSMAAPGASGSRPDPASIAKRTFPSRAGHD
jgi:hypothetical protein